MSTDRESAGRKVGEQFVGVFFNCLANQPGDLANFFTKESQASIGDTESFAILDATVRGDDIAAAIAGRFQDAIMKVNSIDIHCTASKSIIIMVIGHAEDDNNSRDFAFTFNLESRNLHGVGERYFLLNCILRFLGSSAPFTKPVEQAVVKEAPREQAPTQVAPEVKSYPVPATQEPKKKPESKPPQRAEASPAQQQQKPSKPQDSNAKPSYASMVKPQTDVEEVQESRSTSAPVIPAQSQAAAQQQQTAQVASQKGPKGRVGVDMAHSLYVSSTAGKLTEEGVRAVASLFGEVKSVKAFETKGHAFVEYTTEEAVQQALAAYNAKGPIADANGIPLSFEERKAPANRPARPSNKRRGGQEPSRGGSNAGGGNRPPRAGGRQQKK